tara:strand:+ start:294 stop:491 length:198 start_codon:yes stop_codon:yes gene_type:complete
MRRQITYFLRAVLTIALAVGMILSFNSRMISHDLTNLTPIAVDHQAEIGEHGHAHDGDRQVVAVC